MIYVEVKRAQEVNNRRNKSMPQIYKRGLNNTNVVDVFGYF